MINIVSPRIHNLGDFSHCLPALSGLYKHTNDKMHFIICDRLQRFKGIKELLLGQEMFERVSFYHEICEPTHALLIDDTVDKGEHGLNSAIAHRYANFIKQKYKNTIEFNIDDDFELQVPFVETENNTGILVGDRWAPKDATDVDDRRLSNVIESSGILKDFDVNYLDYTKDLVYNCNLIKKSNKFITTVTGIAVLSDLMKKETIILYDDDMTNWNNKTIDEIFTDHFYSNRKTSIHHIRKFDTNTL